MCGIIGIVSKNKCLKIALNGLKMLEYRGYDSAGVCFDRNGLFSVKSLGLVDNLISKCEDYESSRVIAHTRWATHGKPSVVNCHPHFDHYRRWAIVHNGVIENFKPLREEFESQGVEFVSDTDTEVIADIMGSHTDGIEGLKDCHDRLTGSYAIVCMSIYDDKLYAIKNKCPLYVAYTDDGVMFSSDVICFGLGREYYTLDNGEMVEASADKITIYDAEGKIIDKPHDVVSELNSTRQISTLHHMLSEIMETGERLRGIFDSRDLYDFDFARYDKIYLVGCGSAYNSALIMKYYFSLANIDVVVERASEFIYNKMALEGSLCVFISQSGETADTISACKRALNEGAYTLAITNSPSSMLSSICHQALPIMAGREVAVASTKAYTCQVFIGYLLARFDIDRDGVLRCIDCLPMIDVNSIQAVAGKIKWLDKVVFLGRGVDYYTVVEANLKLKEVSYINCTAYPSGELKHGPLALIDNGDYSILCLTQKHLIDKSSVCINEIRARGGNIILVTQFGELERLCGRDDMFIKLPEASEELMPIVSTVALQYLAYYTSIGKSINPDRPRNLAKSVTVE